MNTAKSNVLQAQDCGICHEEAEDPVVRKIMIGRRSDSWLKVMVLLKEVFSQFISFMDLINYSIQKVFLTDPWWNPAVEQHAQDRIHRIGQYKPMRLCLGFLFY
ncbi:uncharacterized protein [Aristolochia californica]|uniref:uncharacterized protein n=1 Tax=Aristolochia californica TaxID=171875 RepID=UPI0035D946D9